MLQPGEVHLWRVSLHHEDRVKDCLEVLSAPERVRAEHFVFERDRRHYVISHAALRMLLARYVRDDPRDLEFEADENGKPRLVQRFTDIRFNLSHTDGLALIAITRGREVGVDVERVDCEIEFEDIAATYFDPREVWDLRVTPANERVSRFFNVWTRKEAQLKASGLGLAGLTERGEDRFAVRSLSPADGYAGAIATEGEDWRVACWDWTL